MTRRLMQRFRLTAVGQLTCGCHMHAEIESDEEGNAILNRIRIWFPVLMAITSNSPFCNCQNTGYESYRSQAWNRWPTAWSCEIFGSAKAYHGQVWHTPSSGVSLDKGQIYFDARLSHDHPTVDVDLGMSASQARQRREGVKPVPASAMLLGLASWQAGRFGLEANPLDAVTGQPRAADEVVLALLDHVQPVLEEQGELSAIESLLFQLRSREPAPPGSGKPTPAHGASVTSSPGCPRDGPSCLDAPGAV